MSKLLGTVLAVAVVATASLAQAEELKSGLQVGEGIGAYIVEKCAGNPNDGVAVGETLCYRCKMGNRPVVAVFARSIDGKLDSLLKELDQVVAANESKKAVSFVNLDGENIDGLKTQAQKLVDKAKVNNIAVVVPTEKRQGWGGLKLNPKADLTVLIYRKGKIAANHAFAEGELDEKAIKKIVKDTSLILE